MQPTDVRNPQYFHKVVDCQWACPAHTRVPEYIRLIAAGRFDGFWEHALHPWDVAAGALIVEEAGGRVTNLRGEGYSSREGSVIATNGRIHNAMVKTIASASSGDGLTPS